MFSLFKPAKASIAALAGKVAVRLYLTALLTCHAQWWFRCKLAFKLNIVAEHGSIVLLLNTPARLVKPVL
jgi:hypothetical protein